jgi:hypothetical protein
MRPERRLSAAEWRGGFGRPNILSDSDEQLISSGLD